MEKDWPTILEYEIEASKRSFGSLRAVSGAHGIDGRGGGMCWQVLYRRTSPCPGCPILPVPDRPFARTAVARPGTAGRPLALVHGRSVGANRARLTALQVSEKLLGSLVHGRVAQLAEVSGLSTREREVLDLLVIGRSLAEIGSILGISPRTVKFHQANVLEKTGADSRLDVVRRLLSSR